MAVVETRANWHTFQPQAPKKQEKLPWKNFLYFPEKIFSLHFGMNADQV